MELLHFCVDLNLMTAYGPTSLAIETSTRHWSIQI